MMGPKKLRPLSHYIVPAAFVGALFAMQILWTPENSSIISIQGETMGTSWHLKVHDSPIEGNDIQIGLQAEIERINLEMSTYLDFSTLSRFNEQQDIDTGIAISKDMQKVLEGARYVHQQTFGAFDVTIGSLVKLWGFGGNTKSEKPTPEEISEVLSTLGMAHIYVSDGKLFKIAPSVEVDLSAIAKGYAVDVGGEWLESQGIQNYLLEIGGEIRARGNKDSETPWIIGIEKPDSKNLQQKVHSTISLNNESLATSGDYRQYYEVDGKRISHTIDPRTGHPIDHNLASVSVIHESTMMADAWATAISVLGADEGMIIAKRHKLPVRMLIRTEDGFSLQESGDFADKTR